MFLKTHGITAELTSTTRVGFHRYTYPAGDPPASCWISAKPLMECKMLDVEASAADGNTAVEGTFTMSPTMRRPKPFKVYFVAEFRATLQAGRRLEKRQGGGGFRQARKARC